jgi:hypothetical protein
MKQTLIIIAAAFTKSTPLLAKSDAESILNESIAIFL